MMHPKLRNGLALLAGVVLGGGVNMLLIMVSGSVIPPPDGVDVTDVESLRASMHLFAPRHFIFPFLAHALGTLVGALTAAAIAVSRQTAWAFTVGAFFLAGGVVNAFLLPAPAWFLVLDLALAYLPMAWLGGRLAGAGKGEAPAEP